MYPEQIVKPCKEELIQRGFDSLESASEVEKYLSEKSGTTLLVINSVCGCAAGTARPGVLLSLTADKSPNNLATVFAGVDTEAVAKAREFTLPYPPSSPSIAVFKDGKLAHFIERHQIEGRSAQVIAEHLKAVYEEVC
jgi:putative YphP/YqiW family bacilliredoxin